MVFFRLKQRDLPKALNKVSWRRKTGEPLMKSEAGFDTLKGAICFISQLCSAPSVLRK